jgi:hypothetical protein
MGEGGRGITVLVQVQNWTVQMCTRKNGYLYRAII